MSADTSPTMVWIEGVGNEVVATCSVMVATIILCLAWYSTRLTQNQTRMTNLRIRRSGVVLNRLPESSTTDPRRDHTHSSHENASSPAESPPDTSVSTTTTETLQASSGDTESQSDDGEGTTPSVTENPEADTVDAQVSSSQSTVEGDIMSPTSLNGTNLDERTDLSDSDSDQSTPQTTESSPDGDVPTPDQPSNSVTPTGADDDLSTLKDADGDTGKSEPTGIDTSSQIHSVGDMSTPASEAGAEQSEPCPALPEGSMRLKLKFLTETERVVIVNKEDTIETVKRNNFSTEMSNNKMVRFIYNGQELQNPRTLQSYNITDNTVIHTLISEAATPNNPSQPNLSVDAVQFNAGILMVPLFGVILGLIWYLRLEYGQFFTLTSTISLLVISIVFVFGLLAQRLPARNPTFTRRTRTYGININEGTTTNN